MMVTASDAKDQAPFVTEVFSAILNGKKPGEIPQEYLSPPYLCINLDAAGRLWEEDGALPEELILSAERIYHDGGEEER